jgi:solute carrier family 25 2-oxodicarboxylate transporter 21
MEAPKRATKFAANDSWGAFYRNLFGVEKQNQSLAILTGATAGATESFVVVPFELVKIRLQDRASAGKYNGMLDVVRKIIAAEGPLALYNGLESTLWRHILWNSGYFGCIFQVRAQMPKPEPGNKTQQTRNDLIAGSIGGTAGTILNTPMDVVKSRIQNSPKIAGQTPKYNWAWPAVGTVMKEEGFGALYKGFMPKVLRLGPWYPACCVYGSDGLLQEDEGGDCLILCFNRCLKNVCFRSDRFRLFMLMRWIGHAGFRWFLECAIEDILQCNSMRGSHNWGFPPFQNE